MNQKIRTALIGHGHIGKWHAQKVDLCPEAVLSFIVEPHPTQKVVAQTSYPQVKVVDEISEIINHVQAAIVTTPTSLHFEQVMFLLEKGIHVFCEKPLCLNVEQAKQIKELVVRKNLVLQVGHSERFHECWEWAKTKYNSYLEGATHIRMNRLGVFKGRATDVDVVQDLMIHDLDLLTYLFQEKPLKIKSFGQKYITSKWDYVSTEILWSSGLTANLTAGRNYVKEVRELEVVSPHGVLVFDLFANRVHHTFSNPNDQGDFCESITYSKRDHLLLEQEQFFKAISKGHKPPVGIEDGLWAVKMINSVLLSLESGQEVMV